MSARLLLNHKLRSDVVIGRTQSTTVVNRVLSSLKMRGLWVWKSLGLTIGSQPTKLERNIDNITSTEARYVRWDPRFCCVLF